MFADKRPLKAGLALLAVTSALTLFRAETTRAQSVVQEQSAAPTLTSILARLTADEGKIAGLQSTVSSQAATIQTLQSQKTTASANTASTTTTYGPFTVTGSDVYLTGYNLHILSGSGSTYGAINGKGNLIIGYNESRGTNQDVRTGSHNLILGAKNNFSGYGGLVAGADNGITGGYTTITGGYGNRAIGTYSSVSGGQNLTASAAYELEPVGSLQTQVTAQGKITGLFSLSTDPSRSDGAANTELTLSSVNLHVVNGLGATNGEPGNPTDTSTPVVNGLGNLIIGYDGTQGNDSNGNSRDARYGSHNLVLGDQNNYYSCAGIVAGIHNYAVAPYATVTGGQGHQAMGLLCSISGGFNNYVSGQYASISGGSANEATADYSSISGGSSNEATGDHSWIGGGYYNFGRGQNVSVAGGFYNSAEGLEAEVGGGQNNRAVGSYSSVGGGGSNQANGTNAAVSGGYLNQANGINSSATGGGSNTAANNYSSVGGGESHTVSIDYGWAAAALHSP